MIVDVPGQRRPLHKRIPSSEFQWNESGIADPEGKLDPGQIKWLAISDVTGALSPDKQRNTTGIADVHAAP